MILNNDSAASLWRVLCGMLLAGLLLTACEHKYVLITEPGGAEVYTGQKKIGNTPVKIVGDQLQSAHKANGYYIEVRKQGFTDMVVVFPDSYGKAEMYLILEPETEKSVKVRKNFIKGKAFSADLLRVLEYQTQVIQGEKPDPEGLKQLVKRYPDSGTASLLYAISTFQDDLESARYYARLAKERAPDDQEIVETATTIVSDPEGENE